MTGEVGAVAALWRYPVASLCGEAIESVGRPDVVVPDPVSRGDAAAAI